ncbi:hypothetical protein GCM10011612_16670 [Actinomyces gaoshouyii]|uniref:Glycosyl transferase family 4 n=2 Tax=Actinomyces gaoshouyii TaxID=1960083 RepID=A0A8H9LGI0_9ACTO|nr:hypothetical protein GCM10011612_16670 [Actinomyces gaoshouyii]
MTPPALPMPQSPEASWETWGLAMGALTGLVAGVVLTAVTIPVLRRAGVIDVPVDRSLHARPVPRGGGGALILAAVLAAGTGLAGAVAEGAIPRSDRLIEVVSVGLSTILALTILGLGDDLYTLPIGARLLAQAGLGAGLALLTTSITGAPLWLVIPLGAGAVAMINATNFMDGANGLAAGHALVAAAYYTHVASSARIPGLALVMAGLGGAAAGFLPFNAPRARVFLGDAGSYALGAAWSFGAALCLASGVPLLVAVAPLLVLATDTGLTLWRRARSGQRWYEPHREHVYQRLVAAGWPHWAVALLVGACAAACSVVALASWEGPGGHVARAPGIIGMLVVLACYMSLPSLVSAARRERREHGSADGSRSKGAAPEDGERG